MSNNNISSEGVYGRDSLNQYRKLALRACKDFRYSKETYERVKNAKSDAEIERIMFTARHAYFGDEL